ncbi:hypothetical protein [Salisediminibacterium selenitireducens]|uniref:Uncharacterized protein n=1 Tax=Bacillus selenitireducens (strain ATCC 700615 / DSM 15326 / MLS10) TaxID=439292 RepID=D6XSW6_BACIE|nr:hypothetical protein [Salisediminibacterium selenitireducens]ADH98902.1 hypothetical protein Bsel_1390 [[Bacillus] selenitireducens MLS10]
MSDDFKREEKVEKRQEPGRVGSTLIKYLFITVIVAMVLFFFASFVLPMFGGDGEGNGDGGGNNNAIEIEIDGGDGGDNGNNGE